MSAYLNRIPTGTYGIWHAATMRERARKWMMRARKEDVVMVKRICVSYARRDWHEYIGQMRKVQEKAA